MSVIAAKVYPDRVELASDSIIIKDELLVFREDGAV